MQDVQVVTVPRQVEQVPEQVVKEHVSVRRVAPVLHR